MRWVRSLVLIVTAAFGFLHFRDARATTGGPQLAEILGWDAGESKVFFRTLWLDESGYPPGIYYFNLAGPKPERLMRISWSGGAVKSAHYDANLRALRRRLKHLEERLAPTIPEYRTVVALDSLRNPYGPWPQYRVTVYDPNILDGTLEATTIGDPSVRVIRQWTIPGRPERIGIVSFRAIPLEMGYEVQVPVLLPGEGEPPRRVEPPQHD